MKYDFVQIGANVGNTDNDPVYPRVKKGELKTGFLIEANPKCIPHLMENYRDYDLSIYNLAISDKNGTLKFYIDNYDVDTGTSQHASVSRDFQTAHHHGVGNDVIHETEVECVTLEHFFAANEIEHVDWLYVDAEGHDFQILMAVDFSKISVNHIYFENSHTDGPHNRSINYNTLKERLQSFRYDVISEDKGNTTLRKHEISN